MKFITIIIAVISLGVALVHGGRLRRALSPDQIKELGKLDFQQDPQCGIFTEKLDFNNFEALNNLTLPWMVSLTRANDSHHICDGVLIYPDVLMTSASCIKPHMSVELIATAKSMKMIFRGKRSLLFDPYEREVASVHINPSYQACSRLNNNAVVILSKPFDLDDYIKVACLPIINQVYYTGQCVQSIVEDRSDTANKWHDDNQCKGQDFILPSPSESMADASCEQGNNTDAVVRESHSYSLSCEIIGEPGKFYYLGSRVYVSLCGPVYWKYRMFDFLYESMTWLHGILKRRTSYDNPN